MKPFAPVTRSREQARQYYNRISGIYDWLTSSEKPLIEKGIETLSPQPGESIFEIGCGSGTGLKLISESLSKSGIIIGLDLAYQMLLESQKKSKTGLVEGDGTNLPLQSKRFDGVFCSFTLELFPAKEIPRVLGEIRRVLKAEGRLIIVALSVKPRTLAVRLYEFAHKLFPVALDCRPIPLENILIENGYRIQTKTELINWGLPVKIIASEPA